MTATALAPVQEDRDAKRSQALLKAIGLDKVPPEQRELALAIAKRYELDLLLKHLVLIDGRPYITRDGLLWVAHRSGALDGIEVTDPEVVTMPSIGEFWRATCSVYRKDMSRPFTYAGRYPTKGGNQRFAPEMAVKVAEVMALRRAFNVSAPTLEERWDLDPSAIVAIEPEPPLAESIAAKRAAITSGPTAPLAAGSGQAGGSLASSGEPPHPAETHAGARAATTDSGRSSRPAPLDAGRSAAPSRRTVSPAEGAHPESEGATEEPDRSGPANDAEAPPSDEAESVGQSGDQPADSALLCGAIPLDGGLGLSEPCILAAGSPHKAHRSEQGTWPA